MPAVRDGVDDYEAHMNILEFVADFNFVFHGFHFLVSAF
jgi:hypothetical protein